MHLEHLSLVDFRSYQEVDLTLAPGVTVLLGSNGHGKTNLLEAVGYLATLGSHRTATDAPLVRRGAARAIIRARVRRGERLATTDVEISPGSPLRVQVNRSPVARPRRAPSLLRAVVFAPEDLGIVRGDPERRRRFLDDLAVALVPRVAGIRADHERVVRQRTALLRSLRSASASARADAEATLDVWDEHLAGVGADLLRARLAALASLAPHTRAAYDEVSGGRGPLTLAYETRGLPDPPEPLPDDPEVLRDLLIRAARARRREEIDRAASLVGPHRDDVTMTVRGMPARTHASHGEAWSVALALRLGTVDALCDAEDPTLEPVLVLDDVFAELDPVRRGHLATRAARAEQALVSVAAAQDVPIDLDGRTVLVRRDEETGDSRVERATR